MKFYEVVDQVAELLRRRGRLSYRALKSEFALSDEQLEVLKEELLFAHPQVADEGGRGLVWTAGQGGITAPSSSPPRPQSPITYTPAHLADRILAEQAAMESRGSADGERKTITALFADIKGSMELIEDLDPEDARRLFDPALQLMMEAVHRYEGYVVQSTGDGIFAFFGAPIACEDHPQRALYAALKMQEASKQYAERLRLERGLNLQIRVGVNTGEVVLRSIRKDDLRTEYTPIGHSTSLASRMESLATPGSVLVSEYTQKLTEGYFAFNSLGAARVKGVSDPVNIYEVLGVGPLRTRLQVAARRGLVPFVGRQAELAQMRRALEQAKTGHGQIVGVMGEPGVGKSRLFLEFKLSAHRGGLVLETFSVSHGKAYAYLPLIELLKHYFQLTPQDDERRIREKVAGKVLMLDRALEDTLPYLFALLSVSESLSSLQQMDPQIKRRRTLEALKRLLVRESLNQPLMLIFEDLHWLDNETQAFLTLLSESLATAPILLLVNYRPEYHHDWGQKTYYTQVRLDPLGHADAAELLTALLGADTALQPLKQFILAKTEGNPFFMEEIVQALMEQGMLIRDGGERGLRPAPALQLGELRLPTTVQGVLAARIDRLPPAVKTLLQTLAVIGKEFPLRLLQQVVGTPGEDLQQFLSHLQTAEFIYEQPAFPEPEYVFKHALTLEVAYNSVLSERRKEVHERTAQAIEELFPSQLADYYSELAHHYSRSGNTPKAVDYLHRAGQQAAQRCANVEAVTHFTSALEFLQTLAETPERAQQELTLQIALALPLAVTKGLAAPEVEAIYARALALCRQIGETSQLFQVLWRERSFYVMRAELQSARELAEQLMSLAERAQDSALLSEAHFGLGVVLYSVGEVVSARAHFEHAFALYDAGQRRSAIARVGVDLGVISLCTLAYVLWLLGYPDQARTRSRAALTLAQEIDHPISTVTVWFWNTVLHQCLHEVRAVQQQTEAVITLSNEQGFAVWVALGTLLRGRALAEQGQAEDGIQQIQQGMADARATGAEWLRPYSLVLLAETYGQAGQQEQGLTALAEALAAVNKTGERWCEAELYRLKGELTLQQLSVASSQLSVTNPQPLIPNPHGEAEACFHKAIEIARKQQAKSLELRAVMSLSRLWQRQGKKEEAHQMLSEIYGWFTEGFDTIDLKEAKTLLEGLS